ncbi:hypothetical protein BJY52DRAFT_1422539 [Lactarius psammicola]|nr:hypothetical protein BJY52DRAFT_1422539 [Lactarius psammicola]
MGTSREYGAGPLTDEQTSRGMEDRPTRGASVKHNVEGKKGAWVQNYIQFEREPVVRTETEIWSGGSRSRCRASLQPLGGEPKERGLVMGSMRVSAGTGSRRYHFSLLRRRLRLSTLISLLRGLRFWSGFYTSMPFAHILGGVPYEEVMGRVSPSSLRQSFGFGMKTCFRTSISSYVEYGRALTRRALSCVILYLITTAVAPRRSLRFCLDLKETRYIVEFKFATRSPACMSRGTALRTLSYVLVSLELVGTSETTSSPAYTFGRVEA